MPSPENFFTEKNFFRISLFIFELLFIVEKEIFLNLFYSKFTKKKSAFILKYSWQQVFISKHAK